MAEEIDVSFVMTVYNKEYYLPSVLTALLAQSGLKNPEYIFVDDVSSDNSVEIIRRMTAGLPNVTIVTAGSVPESTRGLHWQRENGPGCLTPTTSSRLIRRQP